MFFNPLFISNASTGNSVDSTKENKFSNSNYLFANIINISKEKTTSSDVNINIDENNKSLFDDLKSGGLPSSKKTDTNANQFFGDTEKLTAFLSNILEGNKSTTKKSSSSKDVSVVPEQIAQLVEVLNSGKKITLPIENNGKEVFVEIQKFDKKFVTEKEATKSIKLSDSKSSAPQFSEMDFNNVVADISLALKEAFGSDAFNMSEEKISAITEKIETNFSKLESVQTDTFKPQKNILGNLISSIEREFELNFSESTELKNVIVSQFVKVINNNIEKENLAQANSGAELIPLQEIRTDLKLTPKEEKILKELNVSTINPNELKEKVELKIAGKENLPQFKSILGKVETYIKANSNQQGLNSINEKLPLQELSKELKLTPKETELVKNVTTSKISLPELSKEIKTKSVKPNAPLALKNLSQKLESAISQGKGVAKLNTEKLPLQEISKELKLTPKETELVKNVTTSKISLPELSKEIKTESVKPNAPLALKSLSQKLESVVPQDKVDIKLNIEKLPLQEISKELKLTPKETELVKNITTSKVSLQELSKDVKSESVKPNAPLAVKSLSHKLEGVISQDKAVVKLNTEKLPLQEISKELKLTPKETELVKNITTSKISLPELSKEIKTESIKPNAPLAVKSLSQKLENVISRNEVDVKLNTEKLPLQEISKELKLTPKETEVVKNITTEKISLQELSKVVKSESVKPNAPLALKSLSQKLDSVLALDNVDKKTNAKSDVLPIKTVAQELNLTSTEKKLIDELNIEKVDVKELQKLVKTEISKNPISEDLKSLSSKLEKAEIASPSLVTENVAKKTKANFNSNNELSVKPTIKEKVKSGIKNIFNNSESVKLKVESSKSEYLFTLKTEKSNDSFTLENSLKVESKAPELLSKSIYSSKESVELTKVQIVPINEELVKSNEYKSNNDTFKNVNDKKIIFESKVAPASENQKQSNFENGSSFQNEQSLNDKNYTSQILKSEDSQNNTFAKSIENQSEISNKKVVVSEKDSSLDLKNNLGEAKTNETLLPKSNFAIHQNRNEIFNINQKVVSRSVDIRNIREEISNLVQKGEKKTVEFQLTPENLGKITIRLEVVNKIVSASIKVDSEQTQQLVQNSLEGLKSTLNQSGVQYNSVNVSLSNSEDKNQRYFKQKRKNNNNKNILSAEGVDETLSHKNFGYNKYDFIA